MSDPKKPNEHSDQPADSPEHDSLLEDQSGDSVGAEPFRDHVAETANAEISQPESLENPDPLSDPVADEYAANNSSTSSSAKTSSSGAGTWLWRLLLIVILAGLGFAGWYLWQQNQSLDDAVSNAEQSASQADYRISQLQSQLNEQSGQGTTNRSFLERELAAIRNEFSQLQEQLRVTQRQLQVTTGEKRNEWLLAEAEFFLRQANQEMLLAKDPQATLALLASADERILAMDESDLLPLRQAIASDEAAVRGARPVDTEGIVLQLEGIIGNLPNLRLIAVKLPGEEQETTASEEPSEPSAFDKALDSIRGVITVRRLDEPLGPMVTPQERANLAQNLTLALQAAQIAALRHNDKLYRAKLEQASSWIEEFYQPEDAVTQGTVKQLQELAARAVSPRLPSELQSLQVAKVLSEERLQEWLRQRNPGSATGNSDLDQQEFVNPNIQEQPQTQTSDQNDDGADQ